MKPTANNAGLLVTLLSACMALSTACSHMGECECGDEDEKSEHVKGKHHEEEREEKGEKEEDEEDEKEEHGAKNAAKADFSKDFGIAQRKLSPTGEAPFFILKPGFQIVLAGPDGKVEITVLDKTQDIGGVTTRVVEEREWAKGEIEEISRNFFAIDEATKDVFYFGEEVDMYKNGKVVKNEGAWRADEPGNSAGLAIPGNPKVGDRFYMEIAPGKALDRAEIVSLGETLVTPAGTFKDVVKTKETSGLNPAEKEFKHYARGIGQIQDEDLLLTKYGYINGK